MRRCGHRLPSRHTLASGCTKSSSSSSRALIESLTSLWVYPQPLAGGTEKRRSKGETLQKGGSGVSESSELGGMLRLQAAASWPPARQLAQ